ncbi:MAG: hypothetical protein CVT49_03940 [candidate division Zixibacteria bacterium HGW-Zixibacteria-1]|nr:MAG: hypothetical protein CVT49_03940 [candidate division Zixibacteria bacterium HGW-Zixibacteria-1]
MIFPAANNHIKSEFLQSFFNFQLSRFQYVFYGGNGYVSTVFLLTTYDKKPFYIFESNRCLKK